MISKSLLIIWLICCYNGRNTTQEVGESYMDISFWWLCSGHGRWNKWKFQHLVRHFQPAKKRFHTADPLARILLKANAKNKPWSITTPFFSIFYLRYPAVCLAIKFWWYSSAMKNWVAGSKSTCLAPDMVDKNFSATSFCSSFKYHRAVRYCVLQG